MHVQLNSPLTLSWGNRQLPLAKPFLGREYLGRPQALTTAVLWAAQGWFGQSMGGPSHLWPSYSTEEFCGLNIPRQVHAGVQSIIVFPTLASMPSDSSAILIGTWNKTGGALQAQRVQKHQRLGKVPRIQEAKGLCL